VFSNTTLRRKTFADRGRRFEHSLADRLALRARSIGGAALLAGFEVGRVKN
jgi:hypothetical protein